MRSKVGRRKPAVSKYYCRVELLNRHRPLTIAMIIRLREKLGISAAILIGPHRRVA